MRPITVVIGSLLLLGAGCAGSSQQTRAESKPEPKPVSVALGPGTVQQEKKISKAELEDRMICERETVIGSNIPRLVCRKALDLERAKQASEDYFERPTNCGGIRCAEPN